ASFTQVGSAIDVAHAFLIDENEIGNLTIDPNSHTIYQSFSGIANATEAVLPTAFHAVWLARSRDGGQTFTDHAVYVNPDNSVAYGHQFVNVTVAGSKFTQVKASPIVHLGGACESGVTCTGNRDLFDDFGVAVSPTTGLASIAYSDDQPGNTSSDDHTAIATQTGGPKICAGT